METSHSGFRYATVDTTNVLSSYFMTIDMCKFALMRLVYSRDKFFRVGPNISEKFVPGRTNFRGVQIKRDKTTVEPGNAGERGQLAMCVMHAVKVSQPKVPYRRRPTSMHEIAEGKMTG